MKVIILSLVAGAVLIFDLAVAKDSPDAPQMAPMALNSYTWVPSSIAAANVLDLDGEVIGHVQKLDLDQNGKPQGLEVGLSGSGQVISVVAYNMSYDEQQNIVTVGLDKNQVAQMSQTPHN